MNKHQSFNLLGLLAIWGLFLFQLSPSLAQSNDKKAKQPAYIDKKGVLRWKGTNEEIHGFGVNYTVPFAHAYRSAKKLGIDPKKAIDKDIYHFSRLGFDLYRIHVWDTEICDSLGNLIENEHLDAFDYLLQQLKEKQINYVVTPIAFWGNGWPEPDGDTPGFSHKYGKDKSLTNPDAIKAQENYLYQFLNHVNPYTGLAYKDDPSLIAFEISNEPHHRGAPKSVTTYIDKMVKSMRKTGCEKPIFYNVTHSIQLAEAYFDANIRGGTFQWYPTGLGFGKELEGNFLPNVDRYTIPFDEVIKKNGGGKLVYEFDAADIGRSYIYPAIARSFRTAGIQIGCHFSYDPTYLAYANTEYNTHYMNLAYTPQKALSLMVAYEVFHQMPRYKDYGSYPENTQFGNVHLSAEGDLAEYISEEKVIYTNHTNAEISDTDKLQTIAGFGNSKVVQYKGLGAYFLDKIETGVWRLEVMPDAIWVDNIFGQNSLSKQLAVIKWNKWDMAINLTDLGHDFTLEAINKGNDFSSPVNGNNFSIRPGTYLLKKKGIDTNIQKDQIWKNVDLNAFSAPEQNLSKHYCLHQPINETIANKPITIKATIVTENAPEEVILTGYGTGKPLSLTMEPKAGYDYEVQVPAESLNTGILKYFISVKKNGTFVTYPSGKNGKQGDWDFDGREAYQLNVIEGNSPVYLFDAIQDSDYLMKLWKKDAGILPSSEPNKGEYFVNLEQLFEADPENTNGDKIYDYSMKYNFQKRVQYRKASLNDKQKLIIKARALNNKPCKLQVALIMKDGAAYGKVITLSPEKAEHEINLSVLNTVKYVILPRPYPSFLPYYFENDNPVPFDIQNATDIQFSIGPEIPNSELDEKHGIAIESVRLE
ncbi:membrane or secreted protein [Limibacter armeniacum]|uniref:membrane or secreted protein n=1 Tax=Limibacter armeniacum TaxID=466084 RepID=UPI002FE6090A